jgi:acetyl esterase/lipase
MHIDKIDPQLRKLYGRIPSVPFHNRLFLSLFQFLSKFQGKPTSMLGVEIRDYDFGDSGVRVYTPNGEPSGAGLLWIHGGGYIIGNANINDRDCALYAKKLNLTVVSVEYRLAPKHPFPAASDDCFAAWQWFLNHADELGVSPHRIVISGQSAGGGLAAGLVQRIHDAGGIQPAGQALFCPMLDDRTATRTELDSLKHRLWSNKNNRGAWRYYLNQEPGLESVPAYAAPARREDLSNLPPTWMAVGDIDLFFDENQQYAKRLQEAGVDCEFRIAPGGPHGFEGLVPDADISKNILQSNNQFLSKILNL